MKRKLVLIAITSVFAIGINAQGVKPISRSAPDTLKSPGLKPGKAKIVGGALMNPANDLMQNIALSKEHTTFAKAINMAGLIETLKSRGPVTVFAPTNDAFKKFSQGALDTLLKATNSLELTNFVSYYVVPGKLRSKDIAKQIASNHGEAVLITLSGAKLKAKINNNRNIVLVDENGNESVISQFDIEENNGIMDVVNGLLTSKSK